MDKLGKALHDGPHEGIGRPGRDGWNVGAGAGGEEPQEGGLAWAGLDQLGTQQLMLQIFDYEFFIFGTIVLVPSFLGTSTRLVELTHKAPLVTL